MHGRRKLDVACAMTTVDELIFLIDISVYLYLNHYIL